MLKSHVCRVSSSYLLTVTSSMSQKTAMRTPVNSSMNSDGVAVPEHKEKMVLATDL